MRIKITHTILIMMMISKIARQVMMICLYYTITFQVRHSKVSVGLGVNTDPGRGQGRLPEEYS